MSTYTANGSGHRVLARLEEGPARYGDIVKIVRGGRSNREAKTKAHYLFEALKRDGLAIDGLKITHAGREALAHLRNGEDFTPPTVRVFVRRAA